MNFTKNFDRARNVVKGCLITAMIICVIGLFINESAPTLGLYIIIAALALIAFAMLLVFTSLKCPYCGKQLFSKCLTVTVCPNCKRNLTTGMKSKGKKK